MGRSGEAYAAIEVGEYWRFDETGRYHRARLAGDRLVGDRYEAIAIDELASDVLQGYSEALDLNLRWERGRLGLYNPATGLHIATFTSERLRADQERARADGSGAARLQAEAQVRALGRATRPPPQRLTDCPPPAHRVARHAAVKASEGR